MRFNWGIAIALVYTAFATATTGFVVFAMRHPVELVSDDYYASSLKHDDRRTAVENADSLGMPVFVEGSDAITIGVPARHAGDARGEIRLYRPSDASADRTWPLEVDAEGRQRVPTRGLAAGRWVAQVLWTSGGRTFYREQAVRVP